MSNCKDILFSPEKRKIFDEVIEIVIYELSKQANEYARLEREDDCTCKKWHYRALALIDFKLYIEELYRSYVSY